MPNVTANGVFAIVESEMDAAVVEEVYIPMARAYMDLHLTCAEMTDALDTEIHRLLTAHFMTATRDIEAGALIEFSADNVRTRVGGALRGGIFGQGLRLTRFGQLAIELDPCGSLIEVANGKPQAEFEVIQLPLPTDRTLQSE